MKSNTTHRNVHTIYIYTQLSNRAHAHKPNSQSVESIIATHTYRHEIFRAFNHCCIDTYVARYCRSVYSSLYRHISRYWHGIKSPLYEVISRYCHSIIVSIFSDHCIAYNYRIYIAVLILSFIFHYE